MPVPMINPLPQAPSRSDGPVAFNALADPFIASLPPFVLQANLLASAINAAIIDITSKAESAASSANAAATSAGQALNSQNAAAASAQTAQIAAAASGASAGIGQLGNPGDSLQVNATRTGLVFGSTDGQTGDISIGMKSPGSLWVPANGGIRAQSALPSLLGVLGLLGGQVGQQYATVSAGASAVVLDVASAPNPNGGVPLVMQLVTGGVINFSPDGGVTWVVRTTPNSSPGGGITYDELNGLWLVTSSTTGFVYSSADNGVSWQNTTGTMTGLVGGTNKVVADLNGVWIAIANSTHTTVWRSTDLGTTWTAITTGATAIHTAIATDHKGVWHTSTATTIRRSVDGGLTWVIQFTAASTINAISTDRNGVWLISGLTSNTNTYKSVDNGQTFTLLGTPVTSTVTDITYSQGFFFLVRSVSPQLIFISAAADATVYTVPASAVLASLSKVTATNGYIVAVNSANTTVLRSAPIFAYDPTSQFRLPNFPVANGLQAWVKAGLTMLSSGKAFASIASVGTSITSMSTDGAGVVIAVDGSTIRRSSDFGVTWSTITNPSGSALSCIETNRKGLWIAGGSASNVILRSADNGLTFSVVPTANHGFTTAIIQIVIGKDSVMIGCGSSISPRKSTDGGLTWAATSVPGGAAITIKAATDGLGKWVIARSTSKDVYTSSDNAATFVFSLVFTMAGSVSDIVMTPDGAVLIGSTTTATGALLTNYGQTLAGAFATPIAGPILRRGPGRSVLAYSTITGTPFVAAYLTFGINNWIAGSCTPTATSIAAATSGDLSPVIIAAVSSGMKIYNGTLDTPV